MVAFIISLLILGISITIHEFGHFIAAKKLGVGVERFSFGFGKRILRKKKNGTEYSLSLIPVGGYVKLAGDNPEEFKNNPNDYLGKTPGQRAQIVFCGPLLNYLLGILCFWLIFFVGYPTLTTKVGGLQEGFGAKDAGIQVGDKITAVDGKKVNFWEDLQRVIQDKKALGKVTLSVLRENKEYTFEVKIKEKQLSDALGQKQVVGLIGISPKDEIVKVRHGFLESFILGINKTLDLTALTYKSIWLMITGRLSFRESVGGPIGVFYITFQAASLGAVALLYLLAALNVSLCIFNLLPLPIMDGGNLVLLAIERIRGKPLGIKVERVITQIGFTFIVLLALFATYNDILRIIGDKLSAVIK